MMTANLHQWDAGNAGESASRVGTRSAAWKGGGAAEPLLGDLVTPPPAALRRRREPALSLSLGRELRMWARGESRGSYFKSAMTEHESRCKKKIKVVLYCFHSWAAHVLTELGGEVLNVLYQHFLLQSTVRFPSIHVSSKVSQKKVAAFFCCCSSSTCCDSY